MLPPGLYGQAVNTALNRELLEIPEARKSVVPIDQAEASKVLAQYLADVVQKGLENVVDNGGDISTQISLANQIVALIQNTTQEADFAALSVDQRAEQFLALLRETANYVKHEGSRPMNITWKLDRPIPAKFLKKPNKLAVG